MDLGIVQTDIRSHVKTESDDGMFGTCPNCDQSVPKFTTTVEPTKFCPHCGHALKWDK